MFLHARFGDDAWFKMGWGIRGKGENPNVSGFLNAQRRRDRHFNAVRPPPTLAMPSKVSSSSSSPLASIFSKSKRTNMKFNFRFLLTMPTSLLILQLGCWTTDQSPLSVVVRCQSSSRFQVLPCGHDDGI